MNEATVGSVHFGSTTHPTESVPDRVFIDRTAGMEPNPVSREDMAEQESSKLPVPTGYRILIIPYAMPTHSKGGIAYARKTVQTEELAGVVGYVQAMGKDAYTDKSKFPEGPWCKVGDYVIFGRYAGARVTLRAEQDQNDLPVRLLNDDEILATISNPEDYVGLT